MLSEWQERGLCSQMKPHLVQPPNDSPSAARHKIAARHFVMAVSLADCCEGGDGLFWRPRLDDRFDLAQG